MKMKKTCKNNFVFRNVILNFNLNNSANLKIKSKSIN